MGRRSDVTVPLAGLKTGDTAVPAAGIGKTHPTSRTRTRSRPVFELVGILLRPRIASWQVGLRGTQADEAAMPGPNATAQAHRVLELAGILSCVLIVSWQIGLLGTRVGEAAVPGPVVTAQAVRNC